jgi:hypothetical protein
MEFEVEDKTYRLYFPPGPKHIAHIHDSGCNAGAAGGRTRSEHWSRLTWLTERAAYEWAWERVYRVEACSKCFVTRPALKRPQ